MLSRKLFQLIQVTLGLGVGVLCVNSNAIAAESVTLRYDSDTVTVPVTEIKSFAETGNLTPQLQTFFNSTQKVPTEWSRLITDTIKVPSFVEQFIHSPLGRYSLFKLDGMIYSSSDQTLKDIDIAVTKAMKDQSISILEVVEDYPTATINVNLNTIEKDYNAVRNFIEQIDQGDWQAEAETILTSVLCGCKSAQTNPTQAGSISPAMLASNPCLKTAHY